MRTVQLIVDLKSENTKRTENHDIHCHLRPSEKRSGSIGLSNALLNSLIKNPCRSESESSVELAITPKEKDRPTTRGDWDSVNPSKSHHSRRDSPALVFCVFFLN